MALPTAMTIFNRSMVNLENEKGRLRSYDLHKETVTRLNSNIKFYSVGKFRDYEKHKDEFFEDFIFDIKIATDSIISRKIYELEINSSSLVINDYGFDGTNIKSYKFNDLSTFGKDHDLYFDIKINNFNQLNGLVNKKIIFEPIDQTITSFRNQVSVNSTSSIQSRNNPSDQLHIVGTFNNTMIAEEYINSLINLFDYDGINDRRLEYERTINFVKERSKILRIELDAIEKEKKEFKVKNKLTDIKSDATYTLSQQYEYDSELFVSRSQLGLLEILESEMDSLHFELLPVNFGLESSDINNLISEYNLLVVERSSLLAGGAGSKNNLVLILEKQLSDYYDNILISIENYTSSLRSKVKNIVSKENEFENQYLEIPENERILRSIERELEIKEALYLLLLQKREEASINYAVVKPTIKIIDMPRSAIAPIYPISKNIYLIASFLALIFPTGILSLLFYFDNKIRIRDDIKSLNIPILGETPFLKVFESNQDIFNSLKVTSREPFVESLRMIITNLGYIVGSIEKSKTVLITSSIKGEGKTLLSTSIAKILSFSDKKVMLIGSDLRNPQIHTHLNIEKNQFKGLSNYLYEKNDNFRDYIIKSDNLDIMLSGTIPPNPSELLESKKFNSLVTKLRRTYDYIIIDSAPCLLVSDTFKNSDIFDTSIFVVRSNHTPKDILKFIDDVDKTKKLKRISIILNGVGDNSFYGYSYRYKYNYSYAYNYGYGYGYKNDEDS